MLTIEEIKKILPHREPFLFIDQVLKLEEKRIVATKKLAEDEWFFRGHFPHFKIMPGVLQLEAMAQSAGILLIKNLSGLNDKIPLFLGVEDAKFRKAVRPGETLIISCEILSQKGGLAKVKGQITVLEKMVSEAILLLGFGDKEKLS